LGKEKFSKTGIAIQVSTKLPRRRHRPMTALSETDPVTTPACEVPFASFKPDVAIARKPLFHNFAKLVDAGHGVLESRANV
jgi:hypothetical protein